MPGQRGQSKHRGEKRNESWLRGSARKVTNRKANDARHAVNIDRGVAITGHPVVVTAREAKRAALFERVAASLGGNPSL